MAVKLIKSLIPFLSVALVALGMIRIIVYYTYFDIPINQYMELTEALVLFTKDLLLLIIIFLLPLILSIEIIDTTSKLNESQTPERPVKRGLTFKDRLLSFPYVISLIIILGYSILLLITQRQLSKRVYILVIVLYLLLIVLNEIKVKYEKNNSKTPFIYWKIALLVLTLLFGTMMQAYWEIDSVTNGKKYYGTKIVTKDSTYISDSSSYYIGKTNNYIFIYNAKDTSSTILPTSEVLKIHLKSK